MAGTLWSFPTGLEHLTLLLFILLTQNIGCMTVGSCFVLPVSQVFFGGDQSGATMHWHNAAFNVLYVGIKEWKVTAPWYRAFTGMTAKMAATKIDGDIGLSCTQYPGDFVYIPNYWGHMTLNRGFTIGYVQVRICWNGSNSSFMDDVSHNT
jgi:hypothetical protein